MNDRPTGMGERRSAAHLGVAESVAVYQATHKQRDRSDPLLTIEELCDLLKVPTSTIYQLTYRGRIPHFKIANRLRFRLSEILDWIERHRVMKPGEGGLRPGA